MTSSGEKEMSLEARLDYLISTGKPIPLKDYSKVHPIFTDLKPVPPFPRSPSKLLLSDTFDQRLGRNKLLCQLREEAAAEFESMSDDAKAPYLERAKKEKEVYEKEIVEYIVSAADHQKKFAEYFGLPDTSSKIPIVVQSRREMLRRDLAKLNIHEKIV